MDYFYFTLVLALLVVIAIVAAEFYYIKCRKDATEKWYAIDKQLFDLRMQVETTDRRLAIIQDCVLLVQTFDLLYHMDRQERDIIFQNNRDLENWYEEHFKKDNENDDKEM